MECLTTCLLIVTEVLLYNCLFSYKLWFAAQWEANTFSALLGPLKILLWPVEVSNLMLEPAPPSLN